MSEVRRISPLLDGYLVGEEMSSHDGVRCHPAIDQATGDKYIVKVISIPASQVQLDALLLTGALSGKDAAMDYFKELADETVRQAETLRDMSHQEGFVAYLESQVVPMADGIGYEVYLLGTFKRSLEKVFAGQVLTHRNILEMGLDLCAALSACRRSGLLYMDLKPGNIFYTPEDGCRIGDVGFATLSALRFTSLPDKYRSSYTAPELGDDLAVLNPTVDVYALGMVLYQAYNGGVLPFEGQAPALALDPPLYADYEMAAIIGKACAPEPAQRWQDPNQLAQALIGYLQRNDAADQPIIPPPLPEEPPTVEEVEEFLPEPEEDELQRELAELSEEDLGFAAQPDADGQIPAEDAAEMLALADELIAHELPEPAVAPGPVQIPMPEPILPESEPEEESINIPIPEFEYEPVPEETPIEIPALPEEAAPEQAEAAEAAAAPEIAEEAADSAPAKRPFPWRPVAIVLLIALALIIGVSVRNYYFNSYLQHVDDLLLDYAEDMLTVKVVSSAPESLLTVSCTDTYGNTQKSPVTAGIAVFTGLSPQTRYTVRVEISGNHKLTGVTSDSFTTPELTEILSFTAGIGPEDASVILNLTSSGPVVDTWTVTYGAEGEESRSAFFSGNSVTLYGLTVGLEYRFTLSADGQKLGGITQIRYTASNIVLAQELSITACGGGSLTVEWAQPEDCPNTGWTVRCYDGAGYDQTAVTYEPWFTFAGLDHSTACTVDVAAFGMTQSVSTTICANPITIDSYTYAVSEETGLTITWNYGGGAPEGGWLVAYTVDGCPTQTVSCDENSVSIFVLPGGSYDFTIAAADGTHVFGGSGSYAITEVGSFSGYGVSAEDMRGTLCIRPEQDRWQYTDVAEDAYTTTFAADQAIGLVIGVEESAAIEPSEDAVQLMFVLHDGSGTLVHLDYGSSSWDDLWTDNYACMDVPFLPETAGAYTVSIYWNGGFVSELEFTLE